MNPLTDVGGSGGKAVQFSLLLHSPSSSTTQSTSPFSAEFRWLWQQGGRKFGEIKQGDKRTPCTHKSVHRVVYCCVPVVRLDFFFVWKATLFICIPYRYRYLLGFRFFPLSFIASIFSRREAPFSSVVLYRSLNAF